jgi:thermosome
MADKNQQPIYILPSDSSRTAGKDAQRTNILAAKLVAEIVRTTLGPKGMDKMLVDSLGDVTVTNDGVTILSDMEIEHPTAKMIVEIAKTQEQEIGDGTTSAVILAGELLARAEKLLDDKIHPTVISKGYKLASEQAVQILNTLAEDISKTADQDIIKSIAVTAMTGKGAEGAKDILADLVQKAIETVNEAHNDKAKIFKENIRIEKRTGSSIEDSQLINGIVIDKEVCHGNMPKKIQEAKIALIDSALEIRNTEVDAKISITDASKMQSFLDMEEKQLMDMVEKISATGASIVLCQRGIDDLVQYFLAKKGIMAARRVKKSDMESIARATGAKIITKLNDLESEALGQADQVEEVTVNEEGMIYITGAKKSKVATILVRGGTDHVIAEIKRALEDAIGDIVSALKNNKVVAGAGAIEIELSKELKKYATTLRGREQLAVEAFANSLEIIPRTLAENAGLDPIDILVELKSAHDQGEKWAGINVFTGKVMDSWKHAVIEPLSIKLQAITSASEVANMILRIDDVIASSKKTYEHAKSK